MKKKKNFLWYWIFLWIFLLIFYQYDGFVITKSDLIYYIYSINIIYICDFKQDIDTNIYRLPI